MSNVIFLVNTPYLSIYDDLKSSAGTYFNLGLSYIAAVLQEAGYVIKYFDPDVDGKNIKILKDQINMYSPLLIGISCVTPTINNAKKIIAEIKKDFDIPVVLGGPHISVLPENTMFEIPSLDFGVVGEGEYTMKELCDSIRFKKNDFDKIDGLIFRNEKGEIKRNKCRDLISNIDELPFPARDLVDFNKYNPQTFLRRGKNPISILTSRGCPAKCIFCASHTTMGNRFRFRTPENVVEEIKLLVKNYNCDYVMIKDDTFTIKKGRVEEFCKRLISENVGIKWHCMLRAGSVNYDLLKLMKEAGCSDVFIGVETGNEEMLKRIKKGVTKEQIRRTVADCKQLKIDIMASFLFGLPDETETIAKETIEFALELSPLFAGFAILIPYPGTEVFQRYVRLEDIKNFDWDDFMGSSGQRYVRGYSGYALDPEKIKRIALQAQLKFYLRPLQIARLISKMASPKLASAILISAYSLTKKTIHQYLRGQKK